MKVWIVLMLLSVCLCDAKTRRDTYLSAYMESHGPGAGEVYGAPSADYGAPSTNYGTPATGYNYGAPAAEPHAAPANPLDPIHAKAVLLFKVLLKILIFKLIVKFIAIICVLFFLPKLSEVGIAKEESRRIYEKGPDRDNLMLTQFVLDAISGAPVTARVCRTEDSATCILLRSLRKLDTTYTFHRLYKMYYKEESGRLRKKHLQSS